MTQSIIAANVEKISQRIASAALRSNRPPDAVKLLAATKTVLPPVIEEALAAGVSALGENYVQEAREKIAVIGRRAEWHLIGHLQTNKAKYAVHLFDYIHSVDRLDLAREIDRRAAFAGRKINVLIEVNIGGEKTKNGIDAAGASELIKNISVLPSLSVTGFMTMPPYCDNPEDARPYFQALRHLREKINNEGIDGISLKDLSMGMTDDFEIAIEEGATIVRVGRALFGERKT